MLRRRLAVGLGALLGVVLGIVVVWILRCVPVVLRRVAVVLRRVPVVLRRVRIVLRRVAVVLGRVLRRSGVGVGIAVRLIILRRSRPLLLRPLLLMLIRICLRRGLLIEIGHVAPLRGMTASSGRLTVRHLGIPPYQ